MGKVLIITNKNDPHTDYVLPKLQETGVSVYRLNTEDISSGFDLMIDPQHPKKSNINFYVAGKVFFHEISGVWYRRPIHPKINTVQEKFRTITKNELSHTFQGFYASLDDECLWVNHPFFIRKAENKIYQIKIANQLGFATPRSCITQNPQVAIEFMTDCSSGVIVKTLSGETITDEEGSKTIYTHLLDQKDLINLDEIKNCPTFFQEYIQKDIELRITVIGEKVFAISIDARESDNSNIDWRRGLTSGKIKYSLYALPENINRLCVQMTRSLGLSFGAIDMIKTKEDEYVFLEINPNGQWLWLEIETGVAISKALIDLFRLRISRD